MTRRSRGNKNGNPVDGRITTAYVRYLANYTTVISGSTQFSSTLHPLNMGARAVELCDLFEEFRFSEVKVSFLATYSTATSNPVMTCFGISSSENLTAAPTTAAQIAQYETAHVSFLNQTAPVQIKLPKTVISGIKPWYSANDAADEPAIWSIAGMSISTGLSVAGNAMVLWEAKIQFKGNSDPSVSIARREARRLREVGGDYEVLMEIRPREDEKVKVRSVSAEPRLTSRSWLTGS